MNKLLIRLTGFKGLTLLSGAFLCFQLSSCSSSDGSEPLQGDQSTLHVVSASSSVELTRSVTELISGSIGVFQTSTSNGYILQTNKEYAYVAGEWAATGDEIYLRSADAAVCAYAPYDVTLNDYTSVPLTSGLYDASTDVTYSSTLPGPVNALNRDVILTMGHAYTRITLKIRRGTYQGIGEVSSITLSGDGLSTSSNLNLASGTYTGQVAGDITLSPGITSTATDADTEVGFRVIPTADLSSGLTLTFVVDGYTLKATTTTYTKLEAGVNYQASVVINGQDVTPTIETTEWEEVPYDEVIPATI